MISIQMVCCERTISGQEEVNADDIVTTNLTVTNDTLVNNLEVTGVLDIQGTIIIPDIETATVTATSTENATSSSTGAIKAEAGGISAAQDVWVGGKIISNSTTDTTGVGTGALQVSGGAYIEKTLDVQDIAVRNDINCLGIVASDVLDTNSLLTGTANVSSLTGSSAVQTDASKNLVSVANTGTGSNVLGTAPAITNANLVTPTITGVLTLGTLDATTVNTTDTNTTTLNISSATASQSLQTDGSKNIVSIANTGTGDNVLDNGATINNPFLRGTIDTNFPGGAVQTDALGVMYHVANTGSGFNVMDLSPTINNPTFTGLISSTYTGSSNLQTDGLGRFITNTQTGTGSNVLDTTPTITNATLVTPTISGVTGLTVGTLDATNVNTTNLNISSATASQSLQTDASKNVVSIANTGTGSNVLDTTPTISTASLIGTTTAATINASNLTADAIDATNGNFTDVNVLSLTASSAVQTNGSKDLVTIANTGTGSNVLDTTPTISTASLIGTTTATTINASNLTADAIDATNGNFTDVNVLSLTASSAVQTNGSKDLVTIANTGTGSNVLGTGATLTNATLVTPTISSALTVPSLSVTDTTQSTSTTTGSGVFAGGVGVAKNLIVGGEMNVSQTVILAGPNTYTVRVEANSPNSGFGANDGALAAPLGGITALKDISSETGNINGQRVIAVNTENATTVGTGAIQSSGGISSAKDIFCATHMTATDYFFTPGDVYGATHFGTGTVNATSADTGSFQTPGGIGCAKDVWAGGKVLANSTVDSTSIGTGAIITTGGISCAQTLYTQNLVVTGTSSVPATSQLDYTATSAQNATSASTGAFRAENGGVGCALDVWAGGKILPQSTVDATSETTGSIITPGGIGCAKTIFSGTGLRTLTDVHANGTVFTTVVEGSSSENATAVSTGAIRATTGGISASKDIWSGGKLICHDPTNSTSISTGAIQADDGGISAKKNLYIGGLGHFESVENATAADNGAVHAPNGGIGCAQDAWIGGRVIANSAADATTESDGAIRSLGGISALKNIVLGGVLQSNIVQNATSAINGAIRALNGGISCALDIWAGGEIHSNSTTASTNASTGAITTLGGIGAGGSIQSGSRVVARSTANATSLTDGSLYTLGGISANGDMYTSGKYTTTNTTVSSSSTTGSIVTAGGIGVGNNINVAGGLTTSFIKMYQAGTGDGFFATVQDPSNNVVLNLSSEFNGVQIIKQLSPNGTSVNLDGGTFTPTLTCASGTPAITYTTQTGYYQNNGKMTTYHVTLTFTQPSGFPNEDVWLEGLPGVAEITDNQGQPVCIHQGSATTTQAQVVKINASGKMVLYATDRTVFKFDPFYTGFLWRFSLNGTYYRP